MVDMKYIRKLIKFGNGGLAITIPKDIITKYNLTDDTEFEIDTLEQGEDVIIYLKKKQEEKQNEEN